MEDDFLSMNQDVAKKLLVEGATLIILGLPEGSEFGIDMKTWHTGPKFRGVKMIPPGLHMFYYNISNKYGDIAPRASFIHNFKRSEIIVKKWNSDLEELASEGVSEEEVSRLKSNLFNLDEFLGPYPFDVYDTWKTLIKHVTDNLVNRVTPECGVIRSALDLVSDIKTDNSLPGSSSEKPSTSGISLETPDDKKSEEMEDSGLEKSKDSVEELSKSDKSDSCASEVKRPIKVVRRLRRKYLEANLLPHLKPTPGTQLRFTEVPEDLFPQGSTPADITRHSIDPTYTLETLLAAMENEKEYIGEVELSFVCFLAGLSLDALEAWKHLVILACKCERAVSQRPLFYTMLLSVLHAQLQHIPEDFLVDIVESENAIYMSLREVFRSTLTGEGVDPRLKKTALNFSQKLSERFEWDFTNLDEDDEDDAPVVVDLDGCL